MTDPIEATSDFPDEVWARLLKGYDDPRSVDTPADADMFEAKSRFLELAQQVVRVVGADCDVEVWPFLGQAAFHGLVQLPPAAVTGDESASVRASNFGNLITIHPTDQAVRPDVLAQLRKLFDRRGYRYVPPRVLQRPYAGPHAVRHGISNWSGRFFGYL